MVSHSDVVRRLRDFVCIRLDHDQMQKHKGRLKVPTQGNQVLLTPKGEYVAGTEPRGKRYPLPDFIALLDRVLKEYPPKSQKDDLKLAWFLNNPRDQGLPGHFGPTFLSRLDRKPMVTLHGQAPAWLNDAKFLHAHVRQFVWTRGAGGTPRLTVRMLEPTSKELLSLDLANTTPEQAGKLLDAAWLDYMKERPMVARGYIDNPHGNWLKKVMELAHQEELQVRELAVIGDLRPPGRR